jgi:hypothetical protein
MQTQFLIYDVIMSASVGVPIVEIGHLESAIINIRFISILKKAVLLQTFLWRYNVSKRSCADVSVALSLSVYIRSKKIHVCNT